MTGNQAIFTEDFKASPYWWDQWQPQDASPADVPRQSEYVIIGAGYAGLCCALTLAQHGKQVVVIEAGLPGEGASTLSGGQVTGGINVGKTMSSKKAIRQNNEQHKQQMLLEAANGYRFLEDLIAQHHIACDYRQTGRLAAAWIPQHLESWKKRLPLLNQVSQIQARILTREELRAELDSPAYHGGVLIERAGLLNPARYYAGLLSTVRAAGVVICSRSPVSQIQKQGAQYQVISERGTVSARQVIIATNGYTGPEMAHLRSRIVPVTSHQIATEALPAELRQTLIPNQRGVAETQRVTHYFRYSPDGSRLLFGGRARFYALDRQQSARVLHQHLTQRFPQLRDIKISHSWGGKVAVTLDYLPHIGQTPQGCFYAVGCNGSGVTMMSWLGHRLARHLIEATPLNTSPYGVSPLPGHPLYTGNTWFMPLLGSYYQVRDRLDKSAHSETH
ncbi:NAD(P)/FAD-dependent oxidoreductase [Pantoea rwandensis]|uniref:FAD-dependent oxidoreductase n=1 Tax=Pantoea rwandensis TaxID=1076550 RepID=A0A1X1D0Z5_9GAMM|nr:FAD-dependent oxidoreductase [Pantoea rwandensis]ORM70284.1 FAD-dependent oxidoreductase [Pantoea rwandensis]